ncbi:MAG: transcriptional repressor [Rikenellaceae bacterium]|nr:transcriptional repressor [Rikenellaceae bacterium]
MNTKEHLLAYHIKPSVQRMVIMEYLLTHKSHPTADEIYHALSPRLPTLSKTTVYNTLKILVERGAALLLNIEDKNARFDGDISDHAHFICQACGRIQDVPLAPGVLSRLIPTLNGADIDQVHVYYKGSCKTCKEIQ